MTLAHEPRAPRWSAAALGLTLLSTALVTGAAPAQPKAASGSRSGAALASCGEGSHGSFEGFEYDSEGGHEFSMQHRLGDGRGLCASVRGAVRFDAKDGAILELPAGSSVVVETRAGQRSQRMRITPEQGQPRYEWWLNGEPRAVDDAARAWLRDALQVVASYREIGSIQGQVGSLQGEIGSIQGEVGSIQGEIGSVQGHVGSLQGKVGSIQGERGSLQGEIGSHQGAIGGLEAARSQASAGLRSQIDAEIETHRAAIRKLESELDAGDLPRRLADAETELQRAEAQSRSEIAELQRKITAVKADERIAGLERQIADVHADERIREIEDRMKPALERLSR
jgi:predicted  nucleic acid-binding Zn-ribbon protein